MNSNPSSNPKSNTTGHPNNANRQCQTSKHQSNRRHRSSAHPVVSNVQTPQLNGSGLGQSHSQLNDRPNESNSKDQNSTNNQRTPNEVNIVNKNTTRRHVNQLEATSAAEDEEAVNSEDSSRQFNGGQRVSRQFGGREATGREAASREAASGREVAERETVGSEASGGSAGRETAGRESSEANDQESYGRESDKKRGNGIILLHSLHKAAINSAEGQQTEEPVEPTVER